MSSSILKVNVIASVFDEGGQHLKGEGGGSSKQRHHLAFYHIFRCLESLEFKHNFSTTQPVCKSTCVHAYRAVLIKEHALLQSEINGKKCI